MMGRMRIEAYCDGACSGNPGPGAAAALLLAYEGATLLKERELVSPVDPNTTNQRQELLAAIMALEALAKPGVEITMICDSKYVIDGITSWVKGWKRNGWVNSKKEPVANRELWERLDQAVQKHRVTWKWVKGHAGNIYNERVDQLAVAAVKAARNS
jgi:ribonuclease HI